MVRVPRLSLRRAGVTGDGGVVDPGVLLRAQFGRLKKRGRHHAIIRRVGRVEAGKGRGIGFHGMAPAHDPPIIQAAAAQGYRRFGLEIADPSVISEGDRTQKHAVRPGAAGCHNGRRWVKQDRKIEPARSAPIRKRARAVHAPAN